jgi:purine-nucleoside phosphorylase
MLGSGWNHVLTFAKVESRVSYSELFGVTPSVPGHSGEAIIAELGGKRILFMSGRFHLYEGYTAAEATLPIKLFVQAGVKAIVVTSASGALNPEYKVGDFVVLADLLTLFLRSNPLLGPQFLDMSSVFDPGWQAKAKEVIEGSGFTPRSGVYAYVPGPHFETPTDKRALLGLGADCVGMSTVPEVIMAKQMGAKVLGLSLITNLAFVKHDHKDVMAAAERAREQMAQVIKGLI